MTNRRSFLKKVAVAGMVSTIPSALISNQSIKPTTKKPNDFIWANLLHLSYNMWEDVVPEQYQIPYEQSNSTCNEARMWSHKYRPELTFDEPAWNQLLKDMVDAGMNMVIIDLGDGVIYDSHPEIAVKNAWTPYKLRKELAKMREMGLEPIPKLNFATTHGAWMGEYARMVSTQKYYSFCRNLIEEVTELFDNPRFFHLGMDEETAKNQTSLHYAVMRQHDLWWHDLQYLVDEVEKKGVRSWIWSDLAWSNPEQFLKKMPKSVLQSNWYYRDGFDLDKLTGESKAAVQLYHDLESHGFDQVPTGSNHYNNTNMESTVEYCKEIIDPKRLLGFMTAPWRPTLSPCLERHQEAIRQLNRAIKKF